MGAEWFKLGLEQEALGLKLKGFGDPSADRLIEDGRSSQAEALRRIATGEIRPSLDTPRTLEELRRNDIVLRNSVIPGGDKTADIFVHSAKPWLKHVKVANALAREIVVLDDGTKLPSMDKLGEMYGVSRLTAIAAVKKLESLGMVSIVQGGGTRVKKSPQT